MNDRTTVRRHTASLLERAAGAYDGVPAEMGDRRTLSLFAMFAIDEPGDGDAPEREGSAGGEEEIAAFLPEVCAAPSRLPHGR